MSDVTERDMTHAETVPASSRPGRRRRLLVLMAVATAIGAAGLAAGGTAGALLGDQLGGPGAAGVPLGLLVVGSALGAVFISGHAHRGHRGRGLMLGYLFGAAGAAVVITATTLRSFPVLLIGSPVLGVANSAIFMTRYAAREAGTESGRGRALGTVFFATALGAAVSPLLLQPSGDLARSLGLPQLSGLYLVAVLAFGTSALIFAAISGARVPWLGQGTGVLSHARGDPPAGRGQLIRAVGNPRTRVALVALGTANFIMVAIMAIAPVQMMMHGHDLAAIGYIIAIHVAGMFGPSPISGYLCDRFGPVLVVLLGGSMYVVACAAGMLTSEQSLLAMAGHLVVVGVGWNFGVVGGSTLLGATVPDALRPHVEGIGEVTQGIAAAVAAPVAGVVAAVDGYHAVLLAGAVIAVFVLLFLRYSIRPAQNRG